MSVFQKIIAWFTALILSVLGTSGVTIRQRARALRVVSYIIADNAEMMRNVDDCHFDGLTDVILIGALAGFDGEGHVNTCADFDEIIAIAKEKIGDREIRLHLNLFGPYGPGGSDFEETMYNQGEAHRTAFESGILEGEIRSLLERAGLDGVFFDYEFPAAQTHKDMFSAFLVSLRKTLGDDFILGAAESSWCAALSEDAIRALDMVEVMCYDVWDEGTGIHSSFEISRAIIKGMRKLGYKRSQLDMGIPFYARPTTEEAVWYDYKEYYDKLDDDGLAKDTSRGLIASFNTPEVVYEKTRWAAKQGLGGVMIWHYTCDVPAENPASLFNAVYRAKAELSAGKGYFKPGDPIS